MPDGNTLVSTPRIRLRLRQGLTLAAAVEIGAALHALLLGGFHVQLGPLRVSAGAPARPFVIGVAFACLALALRDREPVRPSWDAIESWSRNLGAATAVAVFVAGIHFGAFAAGGSDQYGYVSQAITLAAGRLRIHEPLAALDPAIAAAAVPLGYRLSGSNTIVSIYSPGLPLMMVPLFLLGGEQAVYLVVPVLGAIGVWLTFLLGRRVWDGRVGLIAAVALACSPVFLHQLFLPMSDVPAMTFWLGAICLSLSKNRHGPVLAGLACSLAIMTRPNLLPLAAAVGALVWVERRRLGDLALFAAGLLPGPITIAVLYRLMYGSAVTSGYGALGDLFRFEWLGDNITRYSAWLLETQSPAILLALAALFVRRSIVARLLFLYCALVFACYALYIPFDGWHFVRFVLPAIPVLLVMSSGVALTLAARLPIAWRGAAVVALGALLAATYVRVAHEHGVFYVGQEQRRFLSIGSFLGQVLPERAIVLSGLHSGSVRLYGHRPTLRWTQLQPSQLDTVVASLQARGFDLYILLESEEEREFRGWFGSASRLGALDWTPAYEYAAHPRARVYAIGDRSMPPVAGASPGIIPVI